MGDGVYSFMSRSVRATSLGYDTKTAAEIFTQRNLNAAMSPFGIVMRESRDVAGNMLSYPVILVLDITGSMGKIPHALIKDGLPTIMAKVIQATGHTGIQIMFLAIGDHVVDEAPLQVGQFETSDELMDQWLTSVYLEGGGGSNEGESYHLAWFFAGNYVKTDAFEKRGQKGVLITIGDEPTLGTLSAGSQKKLMGDGQYGDQTAKALLSKAQEKFNVYHIHTRETGSGRRPETISGWKELLGQQCIVVDDTPSIIEEITNIIVSAVSSIIPKVSGAEPSTSPTSPTMSGLPEDVIL